MFRTCAAVCTAVFVAVLPHDVVAALPLLTADTPTTGGGHDNAYATPNAEKYPPLAPSPVVNPSTDKSSHPTDCVPNFPPEKKDTEDEKKEKEKEIEAEMKAKEAEKKAKETVEHNVAPTSAGSAAGPTPQPVVTPPVVPVTSSVAPTALPLNAPEEESNAKTGLATQQLQEDEAAQLVKTQSSDTSSGSTFSSSAGLMIAGVVAAVAVVGVAVSQVKNARDADAALATPSDHENIHIEIRRTPDGGSTIL